MGIVNTKRVEKKEEKTDNGGTLKTALRELSYMLDAIEFAEKRKDENLKATYEKEAIEHLRSIKATYGTQLAKLM